jgi:NitT/TauT family transport system substrate-binding protein
MTAQNRSLSWLYAAVTVATLLTATCMARAADKVTLRLDWKIYGTHAIFFIGEKKGFYAAENLSLEIREGNGSPEVVKLMGTGGDTFAFAAGVSTLQGVTRGISVKSVYGVIQKNPLAVMSLRASGIQKPGDLVGKTVSTSGGGTGGALFKTFLKANKIDPETVKLATLGMGGRNRALLSGDVVAMVGFSVTDVPKLKLMGHDIVAMHFSDWGFNTVANGIIVNNDTEKSSPDLIRRFLRALTKSIEYARANPDEAAEYLAQKFPQAEKAALREELAWTIDMLASDSIAGKPLGWQAEVDWDRTQSVLRENGLIDKTMPLGEYYTNAYVGQPGG